MIIPVYDEYRSTQARRYTGRSAYIWGYSLAIARHYTDFTLLYVILTTDYGDCRPRGETASPGVRSRQLF